MNYDGQELLNRSAPSVLSTLSRQRPFRHHHHPSGVPLSPRPFATSQQVLDQGEPEHNASIGTGTSGGGTDRVTLQLERIVRSNPSRGALVAKDALSLSPSFQSYISSPAGSARQRPSVPVQDVLFFLRWLLWRKQQQRQQASDNYESFTERRDDDTAGRREEGGEPCSWIELLPILRKHNAFVEGPPRLSGDVEVGLNCLHELTLEAWSLGVPVPASSQRARGGGPSLANLYDDIQTDKLLVSSTMSDARTRKEKRVEDDVDKELSTLVEALLSFRWIDAVPYSSSSSASIASTPYYPWSNAEQTLFPAVFSCPVLQVFEVYQWQLRCLYQSLVKLRSPHTHGLAAAVTHLLRDRQRILGHHTTTDSSGVGNSVMSDQPIETVLEVEQIEPMLTRLGTCGAGDVCPKFFDYGRPSPNKAGLGRQGGTFHVLTFSQFCEALAICSFAVAFQDPPSSSAAVSSPTALLPSFRCRTAFMKLLEALFGVPSRPRSEVILRIESALERMVVDDGLVRRQLTEEYEQTLMRIYLYYCSWGDLQGTSLLTFKKFLKFLNDVTAVFPSIGVAEDTANSLGTPRSKKQRKEPISQTEHSRHVDVFFVVARGCRELDPERYLNEWMSSKEVRRSFAMSFVLFCKALEGLAALEYGFSTREGELLNRFVGAIGSVVGMVPHHPVAPVPSPSVDRQRAVLMTNISSAFDYVRQQHFSKAAQKISSGRHETTVFPVDAMIGGFRRSGLVPTYLTVADVCRAIRVEVSSCPQPYDWLVEDVSVGLFASVVLRIAMGIGAKSTGTSSIDATSTDKNSRLSPAAESPPASIGVRPLCQVPFQERVSFVVDRLLGGKGRATAAVSS